MVASHSLIQAIIQYLGLMTSLLPEFTCPSLKEKFGGLQNPRWKYSTVTRVMSSKDTALDLRFFETLSDRTRMSRSGLPSMLMNAGNF